MAVQLRQIIEVPCEIDALSHLDVLRQLDDDALGALGIDPSELNEAPTEEEPVSGDPDDVTDEPFEPELSEDAAHRIDRAVAACLAAYEPRGAYKVFNPAICTLPPKYVEPAIKLVGTMMVFHGQSSYEKLRRATHCALMAATIGPERPEALPANADDLDRAIARACALALVESTADHVNADIVKTALDEDLYTDDRLCPGVGDFPLESRSQFVFYTQSEQRRGHVRPHAKGPQARVRPLQVPFLLLHPRHRYELPRKQGILQESLNPLRAITKTSCEALRIACAGLRHRVDSTSSPAGMGANEDPWQSSGAFPASLRLQTKQNPR